MTRVAAGVGARIADAARRAGYAGRGWQARLARDLGVSRATLGHWITRDGAPVTRELLLALAQALHVDPCWLLLGAAGWSARRRKPAAPGAGARTARNFP